MVLVVAGDGAEAHRTLFDGMFEERKQLFVDLLNWDVPVIGGQFEKDRFDGDQAIYLMALGPDGSHEGSMRLLPSVAPHILSDIFPSLCENDVPRGTSIFEITRLCLPTRHRAAGRLAVRNRLISAMVDHALEQGITQLTGVVSASFRSKVLEMGWECRALGPAQRIGAARLGAFVIHTDDETPARLATTGIYSAGTIRARGLEKAA